MNKAFNITLDPPADGAKSAAEAVAKIAPSWPLDKMIAVNPLWQLRDQHRDQIAARLAALAGINLYQSSEEYLHLYETGRIEDWAILKAASAEHVSTSLEELVQDLRRTKYAPGRWQNISDLLDHSRGEDQMSWQEEVIHQISQFCAAHYQQLQPLLQQNNPHIGGHLYRHWLSNIRQDKGIEILMSEPGLNAIFHKLPEEEEALIELAIDELNIDESIISHYFHGLLLDVNGWASYTAYLNWQKDLGLNGKEDGMGLLAIRLAWELALYQHTHNNHNSVFKFLQKNWQAEQSRFASLVSHQYHHLQPLRIFARALELSEQARFQSTLRSSMVKARNKQPVLQAVFCIDVRSEVIRRALESQHDDIQTVGFAGFFGLPITYEPAGTEVKRPQLPGLLAPKISAVQEHHNCSHKLSNVKKQSGWQQWSKDASAGFSLVESAGWLYLFKMLKQTLRPKTEENPVSSLSHEGHWRLEQNGKPLSVNEIAELCNGVLSTMGIERFADTVLLVGHGSHTANNPHAAGLDCGACGGQTGEVNVRVLAQLLNDEAIRMSLAKLGTSIPSATRFIPALHNTTTEAITCFEALHHEDEEAPLSSWLEYASQQARSERDRNFSSKWQSLADDKRAKKFQRVSNDWAQVRPEWGLANNQAFLIAPRNWSQSVNLSGRVFLHDYSWELDEDNSILELLMTAPMIVTHWINMQYNTSVTDNQKYGSGNKVLHNVVGGNLGVFEGNGGDLRIGLSKQSIHDGEKWMHTPQQLSVYIAAPKNDIANIVERHAMLTQLVNNEWLALFQWSQDEGFVRYHKNEWLTVRTQKV